MNTIVGALVVLELLLGDEGLGDATHQGDGSQQTSGDPQGDVHVLLLESSGSVVLKKTK